MRIKLTPAFVAKPPRPTKGDRVFYWDTTQSGFGLMITAAGHRSYVCQYRAGRTSRRMHLKPGLSLSDARREAKAILGRVAKGGDPLGDKRKAAQASENSFRAVAEAFLQREGSKLRSADRRRKTFERLVYPKIGAAQIDAIRRSDIVRLLDGIEDKSGSGMAHLTLAYIGRIFNWHAGRHDDFRSPLVRGEWRPARAAARTVDLEPGRARDQGSSDRPTELDAPWCGPQTAWCTLSCRHLLHGFMDDNLLISLALATCWAGAGAAGIASMCDVAPKT